MSLCLVCGKDARYENEYCVECQRKFEEEMATKGPPAPITTAPFRISDWLEVRNMKRRWVAQGKTIDEVRELLYEWAKKRQEIYDRTRAGYEFAKRREAEIAKIADEI